MGTNEQQFWAYSSRLRASLVMNYHKLAINEKEMRYSAMKKNIIKLCCILLAFVCVGCEMPLATTLTPTPTLSPEPTEESANGYALTKEAFDNLELHLLQMVYMLFEWKYDPNHAEKDLGYDSLENLTLDFVQSYAFEVCYDLPVTHAHLFESGEIRYTGEYESDFLIPVPLVEGLLISTFGQNILNRLNANEDNFLRFCPIEEGKYIYPATDRGTIYCEFIRPAFPVLLEDIIRIDVNMFMEDKEELYTISFGLQPDENSEFGYIITSFLLTEKEDPNNL